MKLKIMIFLTAPAFLWIEFVFSVFGHGKFLETMVEFIDGYSHILRQLIRKEKAWQKD